MAECEHAKDPRTHRISRALLKLALSVAVCGATVSACAQDTWDLHMRIAGKTYQDDKISVTAPDSWSIAIDRASDGTYRGAILRKGNYALRLCTACIQVSGIVGGRFSEIADLVQPWFRSDPGANPSWCGRPQSTPISKKLKRVDLWFRRDPAHTYNEDADDCRQPETTATVWYGSYFSERCSYVATGEGCGGVFLHLDWLTDAHTMKPFSSMVDMAFAVTYDETDLDQLPREGSQGLNETLLEATAIVRSVRFQKVARSVAAKTP